MGRKFKASFEPEVSESLTLCARHHLKKVVGPPMSHPMGRWGTMHFLSLPSQTPLEGALCIWLLGPAPCAVNTAPEAGRPAEDLGLPRRDWIKGTPLHTHTSYLRCLVRGWFWRARPRPAEASDSKGSLSPSSLLFSPSGAAAPTAGRQEPWFAATTKPRT